MTDWIETYKTPDNLALLALAEGGFDVQNIRSIAAISTCNCEKTAGKVVDLELTKLSDKTNAQNIEAEGGECESISLYLGIDQTVSHSTRCIPFGETKTVVTRNTCRVPSFPTHPSNYSPDLFVGAKIRLSNSIKTMQMRISNNFEFALTPIDHDSEVKACENSSGDEVLVFIADERMQRAKSYRLH